MTREEAIQDLKDILEEATSDKDAVCYVTPEDAEALNMAIEALNNSIQMSNIQQLEAENGFLKEMIKFYRNEDRPQGEWEFVDHEIFAGEYFCSICGKRAEVDLYGEWILSNYCGNCGTRMKGGAK